MNSGIENINARIKAIRKKLGYTQKEFAEPLGIGQGHLTDIERGVKNPSDTLLIALSYRYAVNPLYLYENRGEMFIGHGEVHESQPPYSMNNSNAEIKDILKRIDFIYNHGTEDQKASLYGHVSRIWLTSKIKDLGRFS